MPKDQLDAGAGLGRSREHTDKAVSEQELGKLWKEYGIVGDVVV